MKRSVTVYGLLAAVWVMIGCWQLLEYSRFKDTARTALLDRARDISNSLGVVIRSQSHFGGMIPEPMLEAALQELVKSSELRSVALLNSAGEVVASAGKQTDLDIKDLPVKGERWGDKTVTFVNLVDLGFNEKKDDDDNRSRAIVIIRNATGPMGPLFPRPFGPPRDATEEKFMRERMGAGGPGSPTDEERRMGRPFGPPRDTTEENFFRERMNAGGNSPVSGEDHRMEPPPRPFGPPPDGFPPDDDRDRMQSQMIAGATSPVSGEIVRSDDQRRGRRGDRPGRAGFFRRPFWMGEKQFDELQKKQGLHGFVLLMSTVAYQNDLMRDFWLRLIIAVIALTAVTGFGLAWRNLERSSGLQLRLIRASEMNRRLREMNIAAAGLAHETRNPLNIVRGLAQMITRQPDTSTDIRSRASDITEEVDRVTARLNEFIDYSKPREPKPAPANLNAVIADVQRTLESDLEDKSLTFSISGPELVIEADETLLRQVLFNLIINSIQAVSQNGTIEVFLKKYSADDAGFEIQDDGPGIPSDKWEDIFRPYFTTNKRGTGLGLAVVNQIVLAHGWDIQCIPSPDKGARFRVSGIKLSVRQS